MDTSLASGLLCLAYVAKEFNKSVDISHLQHKLGETPPELDGIQLCRCAGWIGLKAKEVSTTAEQFSTTPLPAIVYLENRYCVLLSASATELLIYCPIREVSSTHCLAQFAQLWQGNLYLLAEEELTASEVSFGFSWFIPSIKKHLSQAKRVIVLSLFIQVIALATPLLFENVIDRVLVSRSVSSLHVLGIALLALALFEPLYGYMRSWLYSNLACRVNSELSSRLYAHLIALPLDYFNRRQTGQITARVREMDQIRQFLSGSALTVLLDLVFIFVFIAVLFAYASLLTWIVLGSLLLYFLFWLSIGPSLRSRVSKEYQETADNSAFLTESITGIETMKTNSLESHFEKQWQNHLVCQLKAGFRARVCSIWAEQG